MLSISSQTLETAFQALTQFLKTSVTKIINVNVKVFLAKLIYIGLLIQNKQFHEVLIRKFLIDVLIEILKCILLILQYFTEKMSIKIFVVVLGFILVIQAQVISRQTKIYGMASNWKDYDLSCIGKGVYIDVDFSEENFRMIPMVFPTITANSGHWTFTGVTSIYNLTINGFRIYLRESNQVGCHPTRYLSAIWAKNNQLTLNYMAVSN